MASKFDTYLDQVAKAKELLKAREERLHSVVFQVLEGVGIQTKGTGIEGVWIEGDRVDVEYAWSSRECMSSSTINLPKSLFDADDPKQAATLYQEQAKKHRELAEHNSKLAELRRLKAELGEV